MCIYAYLLCCVTIQHKQVHTFPKSVSLKVNVIAQQEFELAYFESIVLHCSHYVIDLFLDS